MTDTPLILDWNGVPTPTAAAAPVTNRPAAAMYAYQAGIVSLGSDYGATSKAQVPKVDSAGSQYVVSTNPAGNATQFYTGQLSPAAAAQYGNLTMIRQDQPAPSQIVPLNGDMLGSLNVHHKSKPTCRIVAPNITCGANKNLLTLTNSSTMVLRINEVGVYVPPSGLAGSTLLGSSGATYYPVICEMHRITTASGGTNLTLSTTDTTDTLASGIVALVAPSTVSATVSVFHRQDAYISTVSGMPFFARPDQNEKAMVLRPGEGLALACISSGTVNNANGTATVTAAVDVTLVFTQAPA